MTSVSTLSRSYDLKMQLARLLQWWPGRYDNNEQVGRQSGGSLSDAVERPFHRRHTVVEAVARPDLGDHVLYVADYEHGDETNPVRSRLFAVTIDAAADGLRVRRYDLPEGAPLTPDAGTPVDPAGLRSAILHPLGDAGDLMMRFVGGQFEGALATGDGGPFKIVVGPEYQWVRDRLGSGQGDGWFEQTRARMFTCSVHENPDGDMLRTRHLIDVRLHDQGGAVDIAWPDGRTLTFTLHTLAFTSPADQVSPLFGIHEKGKVVPIAYAYASQGATRFGLNLGWFYVRCYAEDDEGAMKMFQMAPPSPTR